MRNYIFPYLIAIVICGMMSSCEKEHETKQEQDTTLTVSVTAPNHVFEQLAYASTILGDESFDVTFTPSQQGNNKTYIYARQDGKFIESQRVQTVFSEDRKTFTLKYNENGIIDVSSPHRLYVSQTGLNLHDNSIFYSSKLTRGGSFYTVAKGDIINDGQVLVGELPFVCEVLLVHNNTLSPITFKHKGYLADEKWYYKSAEISLDDHRVMNGEEVVSDVESDEYTCKSNYIKYIYSYYAPTGRRIHEATLVAEINGKEVRTINTFTSDMTIYPNHVYYLEVMWDGEELRFVCE